MSSKFELPADWEFQLLNPEDLPEIFKVQILSFYRCIWPWGFQGRDQFRDWITGDQDQPQHLILSSGKTLIASAVIVERTLSLAGTKETLDVSINGLTGVLVYPNFQGQGIGQALIQEALKHCQHSSICFHCENEQIDFYSKCGFTPQKGLMVHFGDQEQPETAGGTLMVQSSDSRFQEALQELNLLQKPLYFGQYTW